MITIADIFREVLPEGRSFSESRRAIAMAGVRFNGEQVTSMQQEVEVTDESHFQVGKSIFHREGGQWIRLVQLQTGIRYLMQLRDDMNPKNAPLCLKAQPSGADNMLMIGAEGYGELTSDDGCGFPIVIEQYEGELRLLVWGDINQEDPTHVISLEGAREDARTPERD